MIIIIIINYICTAPRTSKNRSWSLNFLIFTYYDVQWASGRSRSTETDSPLFGIGRQHQSNPVIKHSHRHSLLGLTARRLFQLRPSHFTLSVDLKIINLLWWSQSQPTNHHTITPRENVDICSRYFFSLHLLLFLSLTTVLLLSFGVCLRLWLFLIVIFPIRIVCYLYSAILLSVPLKRFS